MTVILLGLMMILNAVLCYFQVQTIKELEHELDVAIATINDLQDELSRNWPPNQATVTKTRA